MLKAFSVQFLFWVLIPIQISAILWDDFRVKFGPSANRTETNSFVRMPTNVNNAIAAGMVNTSPECINGGKYFGFRYKNRNSDGIYLLFDKNGVIAGIQMSLAKDDIMKQNNPYRFDLLPMFQNETIRGKQYTFLTAYFVNPAIICTTGRDPTTYHAEGTGSGLYFQNGPTPHPSNVVDVPTYRPDAAAEGYTNCECLPGMGFHNFWQVEKWDDTNCREVQPIQLLYNWDGAMIGFVFQILAKSSNPQFEVPPSRLIKAIIGMDRTPKCIMETNEKYGTAALHIYFIDKPWDFKCPAVVA
ncbi:uncharacterized protein LOC110863034 [Folsomia candida]|uniref:Uncharacterized protein n=1 Tax=Folsomia candida TaxID=158441 RepID=A0A226F2U4_FOLCA|nr:uncharacterized protein LOC110863034 [Folsomia candida]XP_035714095.1 uncharacterized protein LOC110863034 [Folsomia candida]OXA63670.1 hypothetical protein Fcan01_00765 [Folsomia candida]